MSTALINSFVRSLLLTKSIAKISVTGTVTQNRKKRWCSTPKIRFPSWYVQQTRVKYDEELTIDNKSFLKETLAEKYVEPTREVGVNLYNFTPLKQEPMPRGTWFPGCRRAGLIAVKIGVYPQWTSNGKKFLTTLLQVADNHVVRYIPPEDFVANRKKLARRYKKENKMGCLVVGAMSCDPQEFTKEYCGLFTDSGVMPKKILTRFPIHPAAAIQPGTPLLAAHFKVGDAVDVTGTTIDRGFQGVMKRWGFKGMPATHGVTKTHRKGGNTGGGGEKGRVWPGTKMPGHMGNRSRTLRGLKIWRINHKYNVMWVTGPAVAGAVNSIVYIHDTVLPLRWSKESPRFPTYYAEDYTESLPEEEMLPTLYNFNDPTVTFTDGK